MDLLSAQDRSISKRDHQSCHVEETLLAWIASFPSAATRKTYVTAARDFLGRALPAAGDLSRLRRDHLILWQNELRNRGLAHKTILTKLSAVASLCEHLAHEGFIDRDLAYGLKRPPATNKKETGDFSDAEVKKLFAALTPKSPSYTSHRALLALGFYTGLRSSEIRGLTVGNIGEIHGHRILNLRIKGDQPHEIPLTPFAWRCLAEHLDTLHSLGLDTTDPKQWLFPSLRPFRNAPLSHVAFQKMILRLMDHAGIDRSSFRTFGPHSMRATFAGHLLNSVEAPLEQVQRALGHASPTTTMKYNKRGLNHDRSPVYKIEY